MALNPKTAAGARAPNPEFESIFTRLRGILEAHSARLKVSVNAADHYCLDVPFSPKLKKGYPVAWVKISKAYVSYHFMPIYMFPKLREALSPKLKARMQGKSCFNFKTADGTLLREIEELTTNGFAASERAGLLGTAALTTPG
jgi:hypothetical protein